MLKNFNQLIAKLKTNDQVIGIIRYGSRQPEDMSSGGDFDLFVILKDQEIKVESLHFYVQGIPVDLNIRLWEDLDLNTPLTIVDSAFLTGEILYDETGRLEKKISHLQNKWSQASRKLTEPDILFERFSQKHVLDKDEKPIPTLNNYIRFKFFKQAAVDVKDYLPADYEYYKDKAGYYYETKIGIGKKIGGWLMLKLGSFMMRDLAPKEIS